MTSANRVIVTRAKDSSGPNRTRIYGIRRGMVFWCSVQPHEARGSEQTHDEPSPWVIVSVDSIHTTLPIVQAVPLTTQWEKKDERPYRIKASLSEFISTNAGRNLSSDGLALTEQVRVLSHERLLEQPIANVTKPLLFQLEVALSFVFGLPVAPLPRTPPGSRP